MVIKNSLALAFDDANAGRGAVTAPGFTFKLTTVDDQSQANQSLDAARTATNNGTHILFLVAASTIQAVKPATTAGQLITFSPPEVLQAAYLGSSTS